MKSDLQNIAGEVATLQNNKFGEIVNLSSYDQAVNKYTIPGDGYVFINSMEQTTGTGSISIYGSQEESPGNVLTLIANGMAWSGNMLFVKKGMRVFISHLNENFSFGYQPLS